MALCGENLHGDGAISAPALKIEGVSMRRRFVAALVSLLFASSALATPVAKTEEERELYGRTFLEPAASVDYIQFGEEGRFFHYGLTSSDVLDTALSLQVRDAGELVLAGLERARAAVTVRSQRCSTTPTARRQPRRSTGSGPASSAARVLAMASFRYRGSISIPMKLMPR